MQVYAARAEMSPLVLARDGGQLKSMSVIDNYPCFEDRVDAIELI
jgi:thioredoxin reductase